MDDAVVGAAGGGKRKGTLLGYFTSLSCPVCEERTQCGLCAACRSDRQRVAVITSGRIHTAQRRHSQLAQVSTFPLSTEIFKHFYQSVIGSV